MISSEKCRPRNSAARLQTIELTLTDHPRLFATEPVEPVARFTDRKTAVRRIWRAVQPQADKSGEPARRATQSRHRPVFREGSKAARVCSLLSRPEGATLNQIRSATGWQAHTVRGFISRNLSKQGRKMRSFDREGERVYRLKV